MHTEVLRLFGHLQGVSRMAGLAAGSLPARGPQIVRPGFSQPIARRWLAAVTTVLGQLIFQGLHPGFQVLDHRDELSH
jgi:hypothetical protein